MTKRVTPATSTDVAGLAGVSRSTVSYILNGKSERFPEDTRIRVFAAAKQLRYRPSSAGRALATGKSDILVLMLPRTTFGPLLQNGIDQLTADAARIGLTLMVRFAADDPDETLRAVLNLRPAAVVDLGALSSSDRDRLEQEGSRVLPRVSDDGPDRVNLMIGRIQVGEALSRGTRELAYATLDDDRPDVSGPVRLLGARREAGQRGIRIVTVSVPLDRAGAVAALASVTDASPGPWAVCCYNDDVAIAVMSAAFSMGLRVPQDVSVVGVDHSPVGQLVWPRLTTVAVDFAGFMAAVLAELDPGRDRPDSSDVISGVRLIPGEST